MRCYLLLRRNVETGPFTLEELTAQKPKPADLIWVEGQSAAWKHSAEIAALEPFTTTDLPAMENPQPNQVVHTFKGIFVALPPHSKSKMVAETDPEKQEPVERETRFSQPTETLRENHTLAKEHTPFRFRKTFSKPHSALWIGCVFAGLLFSAVLIKDIMDTYDANGTILTPAAVPANDLANLENAPEETLYQNALTTEVVPVDTATNKPVKRAPVKVNLKRLVRLEANDYQVGLFGGIKNLRMLVVNKSAYILDKVKFELQYLKPNGDVLKTELLTVKAVLPKSSKSVAVPANSRGMKVAYHITGIQSRQNSNALVNL